MRILCHYFRKSQNNRQGVFYFLFSVNEEFWHRGCKCKEYAGFERSRREKAPWIWRSRGLMGRRVVVMQDLGAFLPP